MKEWLRVKKEQLKNHYNRRKVVYKIVGFAGFTAVVFVIGRSVGMRQALSGWSEVWIPHFTGDGNPVRNKKYLNIVFRSQEQASQAYQIPRDILSRHLVGHLPTAGGEIFEDVELRTFAKPRKR